MTSISALSNASALSVLLTMAQSSQKAESDDSSSGLKSPTAAASQPAPTPHTLADDQVSNFVFTGSISQNSVVATIVQSSLDQATTGDGQAIYETFYQNMANAYSENNSMTSQEISDAVYSGQGIAVANELPGETDTFADEIATMNWAITFDNEVATDETNYLATGRSTDSYEGLDATSLQTMSDAAIETQITSLQSQVAYNVNIVNQLTTAFDNHTLSFEKAADVQGLDYTETITNTYTNGVMSAGATSSYNKDFLQNDANGEIITQGADGKQHTLMNIGGVELYLSW